MDSTLYQKRINDIWFSEQDRGQDDLNIHPERGMPMNPYRKLLSNTALFGISTFGSRFLTFLLTPFYTRILSSAEYGVTDLLIQTGNLIIPIASVGIANGVIRYGLDQSSNKSGVFTIGLTTMFGGFLLLLFIVPWLGQIQFLSDYLWLVLLYVLAANFHSVCNQFARTMGHVRLFALDGLLRTVLTIVFNVLLLAVFPMGVTGYMLANVLADGLTAVFVFLHAREWQYFRPSAVKRRSIARMLQYCIPLIPNTLCSWIINISDRYLIAMLVGNAATGIYAVSNKIPTVLLTVANTFSSAWQLSALVEQPRSERECFFSNVYTVYSSFAFVVASGVILTSQISTRLLAAPEYYEAWRYVPILTLATTFACLGSFLSSIYMVEQRSGAVLTTTFLGAVVNIAGNLFMIPLWESMGAAVATLISYAFVFGVRAIHTRTMLPIRLGLLKLLACSLLMGLQCVMMEGNLLLWPLWSCSIFLAVTAINIRPLQMAAKRAFWSR